jgi:hypothetical protein
MNSTAELKHVVSMYAGTVYDAAYLAENTTRLDGICRRATDGRTTEFDELLNRVHIEMFAADRTRYVPEAQAAAESYGETVYNEAYLAQNLDRLIGLCKRIAAGAPDRVDTLVEMRNRLMIHLRAH